MGASFSQGLFMKTIELITVVVEQFEEYRVFDLNIKGPPILQS